ncbi:MAG TPA: ABC transporter substrate-binding protein [Polyangiaceae bacterium]|nr:ABC transporter substrate-binding protein [Polyangiaceae bacterium]
MAKSLLRFAAILGLSLVFSSCSKTEEAKPEAASAPAEPASAAVSAAAAPAPAPAAAGSVLRIAYSDWPGWVAWDIAIQKGWFKEAGVSVDFVWFEYVPSMDAFAAGKVDAVTVTNGDALVTGSSGAASKCIVANDYSHGNDMIVAKPGIKSVAELKGKKIGVEVGFVDHLLLLKALESAKLEEKDVTLVNVPTDQTPQTLKSGGADAIAAWQPNSGQALKEVPGSTAIFSSKDTPGLIYDLLCVNPKSLGERRADWKKVVEVWFKVADYLADPKNLDEAAKIMGARVSLAPEEYKKLMSGTHFLGKADNLKIYEKTDGLETVFGSSKLSDEFFTKNKMYKAPVNYHDYFDGSLVAEIAGAAK